MKKALLGIFVILSVTMTGCTRNDSVTSSDSEETVSKQDITQNLEATPDYHFYELSDNAEEILDYYRFEVSRRVRSTEDFVKEDEARWYEDNGYEVHNPEEGVLYQYYPLYQDGDYYYYPLVVSVGNINHFVHTTDHGSVLISPSIGGGNVIGQLHLTYEEEQALGNPTIIDKVTFETRIYSEKGFQTYQFGKLVETLDVSGEYCGHSILKGYLFRDGTDVYAVRRNDELELFYSLPIAHHVKYVIEPNYKLNSDAWSQPLFLMEDGSIKAYLEWNNKDVPDSPDNLVDPYYEGGYH